MIPQKPALIPQKTIEEIFHTARVDEVVGDFVTLKKRGTNLLGLCPFHNEKTPSFTVSPAKGIYKCFGCGEGGNAVNFVMTHEHFTYPEALKYLARKYNIEIEEEEQTSEELAALNERESLLLISAFAQKFFTDQLHKTEEGKNIGLSYFRERGFPDAIVEKFMLGYSPELSDAFVQAAAAAGYNQELIEKTGLIKVRDGRAFDSYRGRVIFPIRSLTGRVIGFGARTLKSDKKIPKYLNSPENDIYNKSKVLYGLFLAKKSVVGQDNCYLVEGYTDVVSMHIAGIENVVASSGTSLTQDQIRLIKRYTHNITILYDGDPAGIQASFRGIDMILEEGMNVKVVLFPDGEDPDSYSRKLNSDDFQQYLSTQARDFLVFKTDLLLQDTAGDPVKKAGLIHEIVNSIALIPDQIVRALYVKECSQLLDMTEQILINELNKVRRNRLKKQKEDITETFDTTVYNALTNDGLQKAEFSSYSQEYAMVRLLLLYGKKTIPLELASPDGEGTRKSEVPVANYLISELEFDQLGFETPGFQSIFDEYKRVIGELGEVDQQLFFDHKEDDIRKTAIEVEMESQRYDLSEKWRDSFRIYTTTEEENITKLVMGCIHSFKLKRVMQMIHDIEEELKVAETQESIMALLTRKIALDSVKGDLSSTFGTVIIQ